MTIAVDSQQLESYVPVYDVVPERWEDARPFLVEQLKRIALAVNIREIGWFLDEELLSGKAFIPGSNDVLELGSSQRFRQVLRKVIDFGTLPNAGAKTVPHGIMFDNNFTLVDLWAAATDPVGLTAFSIPFTTASLTGEVELFIDAININIITQSNRSTYTRCFIVIEYMQEL